MTADGPIDTYLAKLPDDQRQALADLRDQILRLVPDAEQAMSYGMPTIKVGGKGLLLFAAWKAHCSIYGLSDEFVAAHEEQLAGYARTKGSLHFTPETPFPPALVERMVRSRLAELETGS
jgi:uncharacterized protein YdhG (YjbR/CyaY superfamily)